MGAKRDQVDQQARRAAELVFGHLEGERIIPRFIDSYVMGFDRRNLKNPQEQFLQRANQIGRQALLLLGQLTAEKCSQQFYRFHLGPLKLRNPEAGRRFRESFWRAAGDHLQLGPQAGSQLAGEAREYADPARGAALFRQRVAPLLDPAPHMRDKAEHAGQKFYEALDKVAAQVARRLSART